MIVTLL